MDKFLSQTICAELPVEFGIEPHRSHLSPRQEFSSKGLSAYMSWDKPGTIVLVLFCVLRQNGNTLLSFCNQVLIFVSPFEVELEPIFDILLKQTRVCGFVTCAAQVIVQLHFWRVVGA